ncbi:TPA: helix-turn-helix domain-containing protein [Klebsiella quasipneumoniae subsp. quasipneumoniae]|uniref:helix-turn-helix domain-containing protein n=1 Tax=Klebsiella TaxID=570 RepID=UPI0006684E39|nr:MULTISPECIES: helix-turn-helix transcriptional regulator [Klebsiella]HDS3618034.1 helix-turn-helix transcriptional regulator [Klebsiella pneumoniae subsp. pneumoniae]ATR55569.1 helix-turn-helix transcriptional regulator [Klebsiella pneumoniae]EKM6198269.1 helix-turn-helix transcriptional regulator [Klebsiella pneumoniae]EKO2847889.1 helix-turn-helix transcriptional regulator [Klebsiella pneumoniae]EKV8635006.1 helix-turn-helix transcriptional regulator [Klebsiella pneumoniae]
MSQRESHRDIFCKRLKEARLAAGLSQKKLGIAAGIDEFVASTRINRYEKGVHEADIHTAQKLAQTLNVPLAYFYVENDQLATIVMNFDKLSEEDIENIIVKIKNYNQ